MKNPEQMTKTELLALVKRQHDKLQNKRTGWLLIILGAFFSVIAAVLLEILRRFGMDLDIKTASSLINLGNYSITLPALFAVAGLAYLFKDVIRDWIAARGKK